MAADSAERQVAQLQEKSTLQLENLQLLQAKLAAARAEVGDFVALCRSDAC